jgi:hypothetical protein
MREGFHAHDGWYFRREPGGHVVVEVAESDHHDAPLRVAAIFDPNSWASIVASVSHHGETEGTWRAVRLFHQPADILPRHRPVNAPVNAPTTPVPAGPSTPGRHRRHKGAHMDPADIAHRFAFHTATSDEKRDAHISVRQHCRELADFLNDALPDGREKSLAVTHLEEVMFWGNAALARQAPAA